VQDENDKMENGPERPATPEGTESSETADDPAADALRAAQAEAARFKEQLLRTAADYDNFRKRARREQADAEKQGREELLRDLLPVFDNLERAVAHAETATDVQSLTDGIQMVMRQFSDTLGRMGIERVATVGAAFDPSVHEAIQSIETAEYPPGSIAAEIQGGYRIGDRLVRPALVVVAKAPTSEASAEPTDRPSGES
jgi:molecular chaperone GrpE